MTPSEIFYSDLDLAVPNQAKQQAVRRFLNNLQPGQTSKIVEALRLENENLRDGMAALQAANDELQEASENQRRYIQKLEETNGRFVQAINHMVFLTLYPTPESIRRIQEAGKEVLGT